MASLRISVGRQRFSSSMTPAHAGYAASINRQMKNIKANLMQVINKIENASPESLKYAMQPIFRESQRLVPKDTHELERSGFLKVEKTSTGAAAAIGYAKGGDPHYAVYVHERTDLAHAAPTQAKWLEEAVNRKLHLLLPRYVRDVKRRTGLD